MPVCIFLMFLSLSRTSCVRGCLPVGGRVAILAGGCALRSNRAVRVWFGPDRIRLMLKFPRKTAAKFFVDKVFGDTISCVQGLLPVSLAKITVNF